MTLDYQVAVLLKLWLSIGGLMTALVLAISYNKTLKAKVGFTLLVIFAFVLILLWVDHKFFKKPWHTERPQAQAGTVRILNMQPDRPVQDGGEHA